MIIKSIVNIHKFYLNGSHNISRFSIAKQWSPRKHQAAQLCSESELGPNGRSQSSQNVPKLQYIENVPKLQYIEEALLNRSAFLQAINEAQTKGK